MKSVTNHITIQTTRDTELIDVTARFRELVHAARVRDGLALFMTMHTTTGVTVNEGLPDLEDDLLELLSDLVPPGRAYRHSRFLHSDGQMAVNATAHLRGALLGMQVAFPIADGALVMGARHTIYFVELDGPLLREAIVHVLGI
ncbi:MAG: secondary thiamine-phosphate synthase enzyme YjbQ [Candidatus Dormibacteraceae bacterium]